MLSAHCTTPSHQHVSCGVVHRHRQHCTQTQAAFVPQSAWQQHLIWLYIRVELLILGNKLSADSPCSHAKAPVFDQGGLRRVHRQAAGWIQDALMTNCMRPHEPEIAVRLSRSIGAAEA